MERQIVIGGQWGPKLAQAIAAAATDDLGTVAELTPRTVELTLTELRALDDVIQVGARALIAQRGAVVPTELGSAQRKVQAAYLSYPRSARAAELDSAHGRR